MTLSAARATVVTYLFDEDLREKRRQTRATRRIEDMAVVR